jgi:predicted metal-binding membrane protein
LPSTTPAATDIFRRSTGPTVEPITTPPINHAPQHPVAVARALPVGERTLPYAGLVALTGLAWFYLVRMPMTPQDLGGLGARMLSVMPPRLADLWLTFMMWAVMMIAMMLPSASPMVMAYARVASARGSRPALRVWLFASGYIALWTLFGAAATAIQFALLDWSLISNALVTTPLVSAAILAAAGIYQLTPLKQMCLGRCQSPIGFLMTHWRDGAAGAFRMGLAHGAFCVGCCWMLMALLFATGVMNLAWVAAISVFVLLEKATPWGRAIANVSGVALIACSIAIALHLIVSG